MKIFCPLFFILLSLVTSCSPETTPNKSLRIISLAPNITETIYALGLEKNLVAVSTFCDFPEGAKSKAKIGGLYDSNIEKIYALTPSFVFYLPSQKTQASRLESLGIHTVCVKNNSLDEIDQSILTIGKTCNKEARAQKLINSLHSQLPQPITDSNVKGLVVVSRSYSDHQISTMYVAGKGSWYEMILNHLGVQNAYKGSLPYPQVGVEGIIKMDPDFIIEIVINADEKSYTCAAQQKAWQFLIKPTESNRLFVISDLFAVRPGPRYPFLFKRFQKIIKQVLDERR